MNAKKDKIILSVSKLNEYVKMLLENSPVLSNVYVSGEISNFKLHIASGHIYFTLKDSQSSIRAVMFKSSAEKLAFVPKDGMKVIAYGRVSSYVRDGVYQIYVTQIVPEGIGQSALMLEQLKEKLASEGLFDAVYKKKLPEYPNKVGVITSAVGAAINDILNVSKRRYPSAEILLFPALVQGEGAEGSLVSGIEYFTNNPCVDVIIIGRGGGSGEDLFAFNSEKLARAIFKCSIPVISAVGHEHDYSISDFVADMRAPTPSAAAELALPDKEELKESLKFKRDLLIRVMNTKLGRLKDNHGNISRSSVFGSYERIINDKRLYIDSLGTNLRTGYSSLIKEKRASLINLSSKLDMQSPLNVLSRGYAKISKDDAVITSSKELKNEDKISVTFSDGVVNAVVVGEENGKNNI